MGDEAQMTLRALDDACVGGSITVNFSIETFDLSQATVEPVKDQTYTGSPITPNLVVDYKGQKLQLGDAYTVEWENNTNVGAAKATLIGKGPSCTGSCSVEFNIIPRTVTVTPNAAGKTYGDDDPGLSASVTGPVGSDTVAYSLSRQKGEDVGSYTISSTGNARQGNYAHHRACEYSDSDGDGCGRIHIRRGKPRARAGRNLERADAFRGHGILGFLR